MSQTTTNGFERKSPVGLQASGRNAAMDRHLDESVKVLDFFHVEYHVYRTTVRIEVIHENMAWEYFPNTKSVRKDHGAKWTKVGDAWEFLKLIGVINEDEETPEGTAAKRSRSPEWTRLSETAKAYQKFGRDVAEGD